MNTLSRQQEDAHTVITIACRMLSQMRAEPPHFSQGLYALGDDCFVLLEDAARVLFLPGSGWVGPDAIREWSARLAKRLFDHPENCAEILASVVPQEDSELSELAAATA